MLAGAIGDLLPSAVGVAISPVPIVAVILMLGTPRARSTGPAFAAGWVLGLVAASCLVLAVAGGADDADSDTGTAVAVVELAFGVLLRLLAVKQWRGRPAAGEEAPMPAWMGAVDRFTSGRAFLLGVALSAANPKNLALTVAAAAAIARAGLSGGEDAVAVATFVAIGSVSVVGPVLAFLVGGERVEAPLARAKGFLSAHNAAIMAAVLAVLGAKVLGSGIAALAA